MTGFEKLGLQHDWNRATERDWAVVLAGFPLFAGISRRRLRRIAQTAEFGEFAPGDAVVSAGEPADAFYVILSGNAKVRKPSARELGAGDYFGEIGLLGGDRRRSATVIATDELHVMRLPRSTFFDILGDDGVAANILSELGARVRQLEQTAAAG
jgi:CRP-like cAMP-binding protein